MNVGLFVTFKDHKVSPRLSCKRSRFIRRERGAGARRRVGAMESHCVVLQREQRNALPRGNPFTWHLNDRSRSWSPFRRFPATRSTSSRNVIIWPFIYWFLIHIQYENRRFVIKNTLVVPWFVRLPILNALLLLHNVSHSRDRIMVCPTASRARDVGSNRASHLWAVSWKKTSCKAIWMTCVMFAMGTGPAREPQPKPSHCERRPAPTSGTATLDDDECWTRCYKI